MTIRKRPVRPPLGPMHDARFHVGVGEGLREWRDRLQMSQTEFAESLHISRFSLLHYELGHRPAPFLVVVRAAEMVGGNLTALVRKGA